MRIETPREFERFGAMLVYGLQKIYQLDGGLAGVAASPQNGDRVIQQIPYEQLHEIEKQMAIIVPVRNERLKLVQGVLCGIPNPCLTIVISNSQRTPIDRFAIEQDSIANFSRFLQNDIVVIHQKDPLLGNAFAKGGYPEIIDDSNRVRDGKAEGMIAGIMLAKLAGKKYVGFIDSDNYFPGAVLEYIHEFAAGFATSKSKNTMVRIAWHSKPKVLESGLYFAKWGRASTHTNRVLNDLLSHYSGFETEIMKTGNAGEHALSVDLAMQMCFASGYAVETQQIIALMERFGGVIGDLDARIIRDRVEVYQIESRNPHLHEVKGDDHVDDMIQSSLSVIYHSALTPERIKTDILETLRSKGTVGPRQEPPQQQTYPPLARIKLRSFKAALKKHDRLNTLLGA
jgi:mannosyl-3-phosphoglycerate synthase